MLYIPECASQIADDWGDMWEQFYDAAENNFKAAMKYISEHHLQSQFQKRIEIILHNCESSGWGFPNDMWQIYYDYSDRDEEGIEIFVSSITIIGMISVTSSVTSL